ncbi:hypothetical protein ALON55S_01152 [Alishewanella longhuensis]
MPVLAAFDRGSVRVVADYRKDRELARGDRSFFDCAEAYYFDTATGARKDVIDPRTGSFHCNDLPSGHVWVYDYANFGGDGTTNVPNGGGASTLMQYDYDGSLSQFLPPFTAIANNPAHLRVPQGWYPVNYSRESRLNQFKPSFPIVNHTSTRTGYQNIICGS